MNKIFLNDEDFEIISNEELHELVKQIMIKKCGKDIVFSENTADWFMFNYHISGYEKCDHSFGEYTITLQRIAQS